VYFFLISFVFSLAYPIFPELFYFSFWAFGGEPVKLPTFGTCPKGIPISMGVGGRFKGSSTAVYLTSDFRNLILLINPPPP